MTALSRPLLITAAVAGGVAIVYTLLSFQYPWGTLAQPGTGFLPFLIGVLFLASAAGVAWEALVRRPDEAVEWPHGVALVRVFAVVAIAIGYLLVVSSLGHAVTSSLVTFGLMVLMGARRLPLLAALAVTTGAGSTFLFVDLLGVPLPGGPLLG